MDMIFDNLEEIGTEVDEALERFMDDEEMYLKYVRNFPDEPTMSSLEKAVAAKDYNAAEGAVHALKGIVKNLGFVPLADATVDMLEELRDDNVQEALEAFDEIKKYYSIYCKTINEWRSQN